MNLSVSDWIGIIGIIVGIIGIVVGIIGWKSLNKANQVKAKNIDYSNINQAENISIVNNGSDAYAVMKIAKDITKEELAGVVKNIEKMKSAIDAVQNDVNTMPRIYVGREEPKNSKTGDIWLNISDEEMDS